MTGSHIEKAYKAAEEIYIDLALDDALPSRAIHAALDAAFAEFAANPPEEAVKALHDTYIDTVDRFDAMNEFRAALSAAFSALRNTHGD